jgi:hypothetical protein
MDNSWQSWGLYAGAAAGALLGLCLWIVWLKGKPFAAGDVFRASRFSKGNHLLPTQVLITSSNVVHYTPQWFGRYEHSIHIAHIASVGIDTHIIFSDLYIETSGGATPIHCKGHYKKDAVRMKELIEGYQTAYYAGGGSKPVPPTPDTGVAARN